MRGQVQGGRGGPAVGLGAGGAAPAAAVSVEGDPVVSRDSPRVAAGRGPLRVLLMRVLRG